MSDTKYRDPKSFQIDVHEFERMVKNAGQIENVDARGQRWKSIDCSDAVLPGAQFVGTRIGSLTGGLVLFRNAYLFRSNFGLTTLSSPDFRDVDVRESKFHSANVQYGDFRGAQLQGAIFSDALLKHVRIPIISWNTDRGTGGQVIAIDRVQWIAPGTFRNQPTQALRALERKTKGASLIGAERAFGTEDLFTVLRTVAAISGDPASFYTGTYEQSPYQDLPGLEIVGRALERT